MARRRWIRLDVLWEESEWLQELDGTAAGCWPRLLCMVKRDGVDGTVKRPSTKRLAQLWRVPMAAITAMEHAAVVSDALRIEDGDWTVINWNKYQMVDETAAERKRAQRERERKGLKVIQGAG
jgi:hypothetical protein